MYIVQYYLQRGLTVSSFYSLSNVETSPSPETDSPLSKGTVQHGDISGNIMVISGEMPLPVVLTEMFGRCRTPAHIFTIIARAS